MISLKKCNINDIEQLQELCKTTYINAFHTIFNVEDVKLYATKKYSIENLRAELEDQDPQQQSYISYLIVNQDIIGYIKINNYSNKNSLDIDRLYLLDKFKGMGYGNKVLQYVESTAKENGKTCLTLTVLKLNTPAISFYEKNQFTILDYQENIILGNNSYVLLHMIKYIK
ncbi:hypothetical protein CYY_006148 [Polysphondylium violaceum]|uniref:N-acetyltransferase domain-containing protein n=1 Tax=Polysphondylium violaceum TaxID=133409 RepID=A0A8J4PSR0_9MYCE|nr:hypothetical protein CYY_006148 [Polysphondylium violaceum]